MRSAVNFFHLGMSVSAYRSIRVPRVGSTSRALLEHRRSEVGLLPARASKVSTSEALHARGTFAEPSSTQARMLLYDVAASAGRTQATPLSADRTSSPKAIPERCQGGSIADHLLNQRLFWAAAINHRQ